MPFLVFSCLFISLLVLLARASYFCIGGVGIRCNSRDGLRMPMDGLYFYAGLLISLGVYSFAIVVVKGFCEYGWMK